MGFGGVAIAALYFVLRFGLAFSDGLGGGTFKKNKPRSPILRGFGEGIYALWSFTGQQ